ncbi:hypothetical protein [Acinetobacter sp. P1(2025)]|uniref:hypothetical protein n=1 Tax=Acinetobacter sp. P1(2025) TaxID=3446120 RepID=UPI003F53273E
MLYKKTLLALSLSCLIPTAFSATDAEKLNYDSSITKKELGVDVDKLVACGSDYGTEDCRDSKNVTQSGYQQNTVVNNALKVVRKSENGEKIANVDEDSTKKLGINKIEGADNPSSYNSTRDIAEQQKAVQDLTNQWSNVDVNDLKATYNTKVIPTDAGYDFKYKCMAYTDAQLDQMSNSTDLKQRSLANQCLTIRTVTNTNDKALLNRLSETDELRADVKNRASLNKTTNTEVSKINSSVGNPTKANSMSYACDFTPKTSTTKNQTCSTSGVGRHQLCTQKLVVSCGEGATGQRDVPECIAGMPHGTAKISSSSNRVSSFQSTDNGFSFNERWNDGNNRGSTTNWDINFLVSNPDKVNMVLQSFYVDNKITIRLNGTVIATQKFPTTAGTINPNIDVKQYLVIGQNTLSVELINYDGPAGAAINMVINPTSYQGCMCKESWQTTCTMSNVGL